MCKNSGFRSRIQKSYIIFGIHSKFITPPHCFLGLTQISQAFFVGGKSHGASPLLCFLGLTRIQRDSTRRLFVGICVNSWQKNLFKKNV